MRRRWYREWREWTERWDEENRRWREWNESWREWNEKWEEENRRWREENRRRREDHERWLAEFRQRTAADAKEQKRRFDALDAAMENDKRVTREIVLEMQEARERDRALRKKLDDESRALVEGLMRVLDRLDRNGGPSAEGA